MAVLNDPNFDIFASFPRLDFQRNELLSATTFFFGHKVPLWLSCSGCFFNTPYAIDKMHS